MPASKTAKPKRFKPRKQKLNTRRLVTRGQGNINEGMFSDQPFPPRKHCQIVYVGTFNLSSNSLQTFGTQQQMNLNSLFDPDSTGAGHQPIGFDQLMAIYAKYKVTNTKVELTWTDPDADGVWVGYKLAPINDGTVLTGMAFDRASESRTVIVRPINHSGSQVVKQIFNVPGYLMGGLTKSQFKNEIALYSGNASANPPNTYGLMVGVCNPTQATVIGITCSIRLVFTVDFYQRLTLPTS